MKRGACSFCGALNHTSLTCYAKRTQEMTAYRSRPRMRQESKASTQRRSILANTFFADNVPDADGGYICYLQISPQCPVWISRQEVTLEHVYPKATYPEVKYNVLNIKPACELCNKYKGGLTMQKLAKIYPRLLTMMNTLEWQEWEKRIKPYLKHHELP